MGKVFYSILLRSVEWCNLDGSISRESTVENLTFQILFASLNIIVQYIVPGIMIIVFNWLIISTLRRQRKVRDAGTVSNNSKKRVSEIRLTKMIITVNVLFLVCNLPYNIFRIFVGFLSRSGITSFWITANIFLMINVSANIVVYSFFNVKLFNEISSRFGCFKRRNRRADGRDQVKSTTVVVMPARAPVASTSATP